MTDTRPGPDELRIRGILRKHGVGPDADEEQPLPAAPARLPAGYRPAPDPDDWFTRLYGPDGESPIGPATSTDTGPDPEDDEPEEQPTPRKRAPRLKTRSGSKRAKTKKPKQEHPAVADPRQSLMDALDNVPPRIRRLAANLAAAGLGWSLGWVAFAEDVVAWIHAHGPTDAQSIFWFVVGLACLALYRRSRRWWWPVAWMASVPAATALAGVLLYAPTA
ncbi:hypothetical protein ACIRJS_32960 [Streptomyces sp. NPDC102340]|uniref:hypothetical protein n=1 Tax=Streptomyces sp. NPDC102340 TaxID=3366156 RepID=UPI00382A48BB